MGDTQLKKLGLDRADWAGALDKAIEALDRLTQIEDALMEMLVTNPADRGYDGSAALTGCYRDLKDDALFESLQLSIRHMVMLGLVSTEDLHGPARMAKLAEIVEAFRLDKLPGLKAEAAARAFDRMSPAPGMLQ